MNKTPASADAQPASSKRLVVGSIAAVIVAVLLLVTVVLPAQYGIDPTGAGRAMGLTALSSSGTITFEVTDVIGGNEVIRTVEIADAATQPRGIPAGCKPGSVGDAERGDRPQ